MKSLVIVLGAGASKEVGLPIGTELKSEIARLLDIRFPGGSMHQQSGDYLLAEAFRVLVAHEKDRNGQFGEFVSMGWRIRDAMSQAISIDNFIDCHANEPKIAICGKLAIARAILSAEAKSTLAVDEQPPQPQRPHLQTDAGSTAPGTGVPAMTAQASASRYGLPIAAVARIQATLATFPAIEQATLYGSRALGRHRPGSNIDLTLSGVDLDPCTLARLDVALDDLLLPWRFDLSLQASLQSPELIDHIERAGVVFYRRGDRP